MDIIQIYENTVLPKYFDEIKTQDKDYITVRKGYRWGLLNRHGVQVLPCIYDWIRNIYDDYVEFWHRGKISSIPLDILPSIYDEIHGFIHGYSIVKLNGKYGVIDKKAKEFFPCIYDNLTYHRDKRVFTISVLNDSSTNELFRKKYQDKIIDEWELDIDYKKFAHISQLNNGFKEVRNEIGRCGLLDRYNREIIPCEYDKIQYNKRTDYPHINFMRAEIKGEYQDISIDGIIFFSTKSNLNLGLQEKFIISSNSFDYSKIENFVRLVQENYHVTNDLNGKKEILDSTDKIEAKIKNRRFDYRESFYSNGKWGFKNRENEIVIPAIYDFAKYFSDGLAAVCKKNYWGFIDINGKIIIRLEYQNVESFFEGIAEVKNRSGEGHISKDNIKIDWRTSSHVSWRDDPLDAFEGDSDEYWIWQNG